MNNNRKTNIGNPTNGLDAATNLYVDSIANSISTYPDVIRKELESTFAFLHDFNNYYELKHNSGSLSG